LGFGHQGRRSKVPTFVDVAKDEFLGFGVARLFLETLVIVLARHDKQGSKNKENPIDNHGMKVFAGKVTKVK
jgi:hypothetical protein